MELNSKKKTVLIGAVILVIVVVVIVIVVVAVPKGVVPGTTTSNPSGGGTAAPAVSVTRLPVPANVVVPDEGAQNVSSSIAVPQVENAAAPSSDSKYRSFNIIVQNGQFIPSTVAVNVGDTVDLQMGAVGGNYDFTQPDYGLSALLPDGQNKKIDFAATAAGKFVFYCSSCGGPAKGPVGYLVVAGK
jgi:plastocyanin